MAHFVLIFLGFLYAIPLVKFVFNLIQKLVLLLSKPMSLELIAIPDPRGKKLFTKWGLLIPRLCGEIEYALHSFRFYLVGIPIALFCVFEAGFYFSQGRLHVASNEALLFVGFVGLNFWTQSRKLATNLRLTEFLRMHPDIHPEDFFTLFKLDLAFGLTRLFQYRARSISPEEADFREKGRPTQTAFILLGSLLDTGYLTYMALTAHKRLGPHYAREVSDHIAALWGKRMLQRSKNQLVVQGLEKLKSCSGHFLLVFNHKSALDFVLTFFALSGVCVGNRTLKPRFIVAKDHFYDNPIIYRMLGIGMVCQAMDMVFIERQNRSKSFENLKQAAKCMIEKDIDIAIYPQGTRAMGNFDRAGKRRDAGYYTTVSRSDPAKPLSHLKKGTAYLVFDALQVLREKGSSADLNLVFVGIKGTANTLPRGSLKVQTENQILYNVGDVVSLSPALVDDILPPSGEDESGFENRQQEFVSEMNRLIDERLKEAMGLHSSLKKRFLTDLKGAFRYEPDKIEAISKALDQVTTRFPGVYQIIDRVYSLPPNEWNGYLSQLCQLLQGRVEPERFLPMLEDVSLKLVA